MKQLKAAIDSRDIALHLLTLQGERLAHSFTAPKNLNQRKDQTQTFVPGRVPLKLLLQCLGLVLGLPGTRRLSKRIMRDKRLDCLLLFRDLRRRLPFGYPLEPRRTGRLLDFSFIQAAFACVNRQASPVLFRASQLRST